MKIAYIANYLGPKFLNQYCKGKSFSISATFKSTAIARALLKAGHEVTIFSPGITVCNRLIKSHTEIVTFPEGDLKITYPYIFSFRKFSFINSILLYLNLQNREKYNEFDLLIYYNITWNAALNLFAFRNKIRVLEYEDNIFNKALRNQKNKFEWVKVNLFNYVVNRTDAFIIVGKGMLTNYKKQVKVLVPGAISEDVLDNITFKEKTIQLEKPIKLLLAGGLHYSKGPDLVINALSHVQYPCELSFYGSGSLYSGATDLLSCVPDHHKIIQHGFVEHAELIRIMSEEGHILLNSTRNMGVDPNSEGYPFKMMEYASTGRPIVSSRIGRLDDEFNSLITFYEKESPMEIAEAISYVIENYSACAKKALLLQQRVISEFSIDGISSKLDSFIKKLEKKNGS